MCTTLEFCGLIINLLQLRNHLYREGKGLPWPLLEFIWPYISIIGRVAGQEADGEWENNCYHFQLNEVICID